MEKKNQTNYPLLFKVLKLRRSTPTETPLPHPPSAQKERAVDGARIFVTHYYYYYPGYAHRGPHEHFKSSTLI